VCLHFKVSSRLTSISFLSSLLGTGVVLRLDHPLRLPIKTAIIVVAFGPSQPASVAQLAEQATLNRLVPGSSPGGSINS
jgi:hypothetical protein